MAVRRGAECARLRAHRKQAVPGDRTPNDLTKPVPSWLETHSGSGDPFPLWSRGNATDTPKCTQEKCSKVSLKHVYGSGGQQMLGKL